MLKRSSYTFTETLKNRKQIKSISDAQKLDNITQLTCDNLKTLGVKYLALDFDGVLASHGKQALNDEVKSWLDDFVTKFDEGKIFILSNKPTNERLEFFKAHYPQIRFISDVRKKPYPDGLQKIIHILNCEPQELALVDDRLLTGCLACIIAKCQPILITKPYVDRGNYTISERFFSILRYVEQKLFL
jgi:predicted HAD superfamily phosphohydrolase YqeG